MEIKNNIRELKLALLGFGNAGRAFAEMLLLKDEEIRSRFGVKVIVTAIATASKGNQVNSRGINLEGALSDLRRLNRFDREKDFTEMTTMDIVKKADYDVLIEMTPLNIATGEPAISHIKGAFSRGKHVITANKGPIAWAFSELSTMADKAEAGFYYETTVMDGTPVFNLVDHTLMLAKVTEVSGILNSTTNFILEELAKGAGYEDIMERGRKMGFVEADPSMDIEGYDAAAKITALLNVLMDAKITPDKVDRKGIEDITVKDIQEAQSRGKLIKLVCRGWRDEDGRVHAAVKPTEIDSNDLFATVNSTTSVVSITTDLMKKVTVVEHEPEIEQTAYGVFGDVLRVISEQLNR